MTKEKLRKATELQMNIETIASFIRNLEISRPSIHGVNLCDEARQSLIGIYKAKLAQMEREFENL